MQKIANRWNSYEPSLLISSSVLYLLVNRPAKMAGFFSPAVLSDYDSADLEENGSHTEEVSKSLWQRRLWGSLGNQSVLLKTMLWWIRVEGTECLHCSRTVFCSVIVRVLPFLYGDCESESMFSVVVLNLKLNMGLLKYWFRKSWIKLDSAGEVLVEIVKNIFAPLSWLYEFCQCRAPCC